MADPVGGLTVLKFLDLLEAVKLLSSEELGALRKATPTAQEATDAGVLARMLVQQGKLTKHQAAALYQNKPKVVVLGQYVLLDRLGAGGMGTVYKGRHRQTQQVVAVKVLNAAAIRSADSVRRFQREAETVARLSHPNLVRALEAGEIEGQHVFVMEFVEGIDLSSFVKKNGPLPLGEAVHCIAQVARALAYAHEQGIVHRDIKPANLMLGSDGRIKVLDMGLARFNDPATTASGAAEEGLTQTGQVMGTVDYMAPEQALHTRLADARADVYSLGCTFYKIVTGTNPFDGDSLVAKILAHREQPIPSLKVFQSSIPRATDLVLQKMLAKNPEQRYQSMAALAEELERSLTITDSQAEQRILPAAVPVAKVAAARAEAASTSFTLNIKTEGASASSTSSSPGEPRVGRKSALSKKLAFAAIGLLVLAAGGLWAMKDQLFPSTQELEIVKLVPTEGSANGESSPAMPTATPSDTTRTAITFTGLPTAHPTTSVVATNPATKPSANITATTAVTTATASASIPPSSGSAVPTSTVPTVTNLTTTATNTTTSTGSVALSPASSTTGVVETPSPAPLNSNDTAKTEPPAEPVDARAEIPSTIEQDGALKLIRGELYKDDFAKAKKLDERQALGRMLFERGMALEGDDAGRYVMLREARELAAETGDTETVDAVAARIAALYQVESLPWLLDGYEPALKKTLMPTAAKQIAESLLTKVDPLIVDDQFDLAERLLATVQAAARKGQDGATLKAATERVKKFEKEKQQWEALARAKKALEANPDDPAANLVLVAGFVSMRENGPPVSSASPKEAIPHSKNLPRQACRRRPKPMRSSPTATSGGPRPKRRRWHPRNVSFKPERSTGISKPPTRQPAS
jgi:serine/threonine protein kinase